MVVSIDDNVVGARQQRGVYGLQLLRVLLLSSVAGRQLPVDSGLEAGGRGRIIINL